VGWTAEATVYYRDQRAARGLPMPCSYLSYQDVSVRCQMPLGGSSIPYKTRIPHEGVIGVTTVESWRNGLLAAQTWP
jgi:hypothetical protein